MILDFNFSHRFFLSTCVEVLEADEDLAHDAAVAGLAGHGRSDLPQVHGRSGVPFGDP